MSDDCTADIEQYLRRTGEFIMKAALPLMVQTIVWTLYLVSVVLTVIVLWRKGFTRARTSLLALVAMMFILATLMFALDLYSFFHQTREILLKGIFEGDELIKVQNLVATGDALNQALNMLMLIPGDCIVIWRAYAVWTRSKTIIFIPVIFLLGFIELGNSSTISRSYFVSQRTLRASGGLPSQGSKVARVLFLLVESGFAYFIVMIFSIIVYLWPIPTYRLGTVVVEVLAAITSHCIGMVPTLTILLVSLYRSFDEHSAMAISQPIRFATQVSESSYASAIRFPVGRHSRNEPTDFPVLDVSPSSLLEDKAPQNMV
ncbi:hypothetical protein C8J56DRAFT_882063 [Mycena floridula]|nr:hypothetical protein C8J56DRAFT_882063 [Mycena floridula]